MNRTLTPIAFGLILLVCAAVAENASGQEYEIVSPAKSRFSDSDPPSQVIEPQQPSDPSAQSATADQPPSAAEVDAKKAAEEDKKKKDLAKAVAGAYKDPFYDNDFKYLCNPDYCDWHLGEDFKMRCTPAGVVDLGGQARLRYQSEHNMRGLGLTGLDDDFLLTRTRAYANWKINSQWRTYAEFLWAESYGETFPARGIETQNLEPQNLFVDWQFYECGTDTIKARVGRQEILLGSQRLVSPLDWANTRRTFDGARLLLDNQTITSTAFCLRPLKHTEDDFDSSNLDQLFYGVFTTHKNFAPLKLDTYWLALENSLTDLRVHTLGSRVQGEQGMQLWEIEGGVQMGENPDGSAATAAAVTLGHGTKISEQGWKPVLWAYYDWASGDDSTGNGWNQLFPLGHKYLGFMDFYGRRNINDANLLWTAQPSEKLTLLAWYHYFWLANGNDGPYTVVNTPFNPGGTVGSRDLGHEIDFLATYKITVRSELWLGYSHFQPGDYYELSTTAAAAPLFDGTADFFYVQWHQNF